ncbi:hypothetical protein U27_03179 [Candidatus Vecturithrix granuli]|uniref:Uncharacterized protein n=1 Tax=Vecturithrix granuli TaxID=1499967 RepID=A0A081BV62_VECG1|nr:hypothetical protein U27_03179 [Candidatus Vecturithrix granuli]
MLFMPIHLLIGSEETLLFSQTMLPEPQTCSESSLPIISALSIQYSEIFTPFFDLLVIVFDNEIALLRLFE